MTDDDFLAAIAQAPDDPRWRLVYADWLEDRGAPGADFLRIQLALRPLAPDHPRRRAAEDALSRLRQPLSVAWLAVVEPERAHLQRDEWPSCGCLRGPEPDLLHHEPQDTACDAWHKLCAAVDRAAADGTTVFDPDTDLTRDEWRQIVTLPPTIARLTEVRVLMLYGSHLVRLPPEIGKMTNLRAIDTYTSYRLHWYPYELTRCTQLVDSKVSTRAVYGNFKYRPPFPALVPDAPAPPEVPALPGSLVRPCSVCDQPFEDTQRHRVWISLSPATDILPFLVNACSDACLARLPTPPDNAVASHHRGGPDVVQPKRW